MTLELRKHLRPVAAVLVLGSAGAVSGCTPAVSTQQEVQLGADYSRQINRQLPLVRDGAANQYINSLGQQIARTSDPRGIPYRFYIVNSDLVNAFAIPGGHIYINRGLIERADNMSELAGVLAHEIGHVVERHGIEQMQKAQNANTALSVVYGVLLRRPPSGVERAGIQVGGGAVFAGYGREAEREADRVAIAYLIRSGISPRGMITFFQELLSEQKRNPSRVQQWFSTHPTTQERVNNASAAVAAAPGANSPSLATDTREYQTFRARLRALPAAPPERR